MLLRVFFLLLLLVEIVVSQDYQDFAKGYGQRQKKKGGGSLVTSAVTGMIGFFVGGYFSSRGSKKKNDKEKKDLLQYMQMQEELYKKREGQWQKEYQKLYTAYEELNRETVERDYEEFKAPDTNNDDMISRAEFNIYVKKYLSSFPELSERDFPRFEEFDLDGDGIVSFEEWQQFLYLQKQKEAAAAAKGQQQQKGQYQDLLNSMYEQSASSNSFNSLNEHIQGGHRGRRRV